MFNESTWVALMAMLGLLAATFFALFLRLDKGFLRAGLYSFSGFLAGGAVAHLSARGEWDTGIVLPVILTAMLTVVFFGEVTPAFSKSVERLTGFVICSRLCHVHHGALWGVTAWRAVLYGSHSVATLLSSKRLFSNYTLGPGILH